MKTLFDFRNIHKDKIGLALCTGPSLGVGFNYLRHKTSRLLDRAVTFGVNDVSKFHDPDYLISFDSLKPTKKLYEAWKNSKAIKFLQTGRDSEGLDVIHVPITKNCRFRDNWWSNNQSSWFVASISSFLLPIQLAAYMGCKKIIIMGADFGSFAGINYAWDVGSIYASDWQLTEMKFNTERDLEIIVGLYGAVLSQFKDWGIEVYDASFGNYLDAIPTYNSKRINLETVLDLLVF